MHIQVQKWGNSLALRIPKTYAQEANVRQGATVDISLQKGKIVLAPVLKNPFTLKKLLAKVTRKNLHGEVDFGPAAGKEIW